MKILIHSFAFAPSVGGIETVTLLLAKAFMANGHCVKVVTDTLDDADAESAPEQYPYPVHRRPNLWEQMRLTLWADVIWQNNISVKYLVAPLLAGRPVVTTTQTWLAGQQNLDTPVSRLKRMLLGLTGNIAISRTIARHTRTASAIIGNPYQDAVFTSRNDGERPWDFAFVGRLTHDKGVDLLLQAFAQARQSHPSARLVIIGDGPDRRTLEAQAEALALGESVQFAGVLKGEKLVDWLNQAQTLVVPSRWAEPFGIVALEGIACGCWAVGSQEGGLPEAIGACGVLFPNGDAAALTNRLQACLDGNIPGASAAQSRRERHLSWFTCEHVARSYLDILQNP